MRPQHIESELRRLALTSIDGAPTLIAGTPDMEFVGLPWS